MAVIVILAGVIVALSIFGWPFGSDPWAKLPDDPSVIVNLAGYFPAEGETPLDSPAGIAIAGRRVYVAESGPGRIAIFDVDGKRTGEVAIEKAEGAIRAVPIGVAAAGRSRIAVLDAGSDRVLVYAATPEGGELLFRIGQQDDATAPVRPTAVTYADRTYFVADADTATVKLFDADGGFIREIGADDAGMALERAGGIALVDGRLVMTEPGANRVVAIDADSGQAHGVYPGAYALPRGVTAVRDRAAITDVLGAAIHVLNADGTPTHTIDERTVPAWPPGGPEGVAWYERTDRLYVTDADFGRVVIFNVRM
jgi:DNA-binding beta-propeller fold protein YncE